MGILRQARTFRPVGGGWGGEAVCGRGAAGSFRRGGITSGTAGSRSVSRKCGAGRERSGNRSADPNPGHASDMPRRNASGANSGRLRPRSQPKARQPLGLPPRTRQPTPPRGHAAEGIRGFSVIVPAVMSRCGILLARRRRIVGTTAARPCIEPATASASGCGARPKRGESSAAWNTRPPGSNAAGIVAFPATRSRGGRRRGLVRSPARSYSIGAMASGS
jgi:hypothetical protein